MILRNSFKSIYRTSVKSIFYALMIAAITALLYLGMNTWVASSAMLEQLDANHSSIVVFDYLDNLASAEGHKSEQMIAAVEDIDFDALADHEAVLHWQPADEGMGASPGYVSAALIPEYDYSFVFIVTGLRSFDESSPHHGRLVNTLYSYLPYEDGRSVFVRFTEDYEDFEVDPDAYYVIHATNHRVNANGLSVEITPFYSYMAEEAGIDTAALRPIEEIESVDDFMADEDNVFMEIADYYAAMSNAVTVVRTEDIGNLEAFHQNYLSLREGRLFSVEESRRGDKLIIISDSIARKLELGIGDTIRIQLPDDPQSNLYTWGDRMSREDSYEIIGITNYHADYSNHVYIPYQADSAAPSRYAYRLGQATIENGTYVSFMEDMADVLPERVSTRLYDHGYQATADSLIVIRNAALAFSLIAVSVAFAVLIFFAFLYIHLQRDTLEIMRSFGAKKSELALYLLSAASVIGLIGIFLGLLIAMQFAERLITTAYDFVSDLQVIDLRYSDAFKGLVKPFTPVSVLSYGLAIGIGVAIWLLLIGILLYFAKRSLGPRLMTSNQRILRAPRKSSVALSGSLRHAILSIRRGGLRSLIIPILSATILLFVASMLASLEAYDEARDHLYENTRLEAYVSSSNGRFTDRLSLANEAVVELQNSAAFDLSAFTYQFNYGYLGVVEYADGRSGIVEELEVPWEPFAYEIFMAIHRSQPNLILTDRVDMAAEFYYTDFQAEFLDDWDMKRFAQRDWEMMPAVVSNQLMEEHGLALGDTIRIYVESPEYYFGNFFTIDLLLVGRFNRVSNQNHIYAPLPEGTLESDEALQQATENYRYFMPLDGSFVADDGQVYSLNEILPMILSLKRVNSMRFIMNDPSVLEESKDLLEAAGYSGPAVTNTRPTSIVIEDSQFNETLSSIAQRSQYMKILYQVLLVLLAVLALIMGFLSINNRREDIALMRGLGTAKRRIFATLFIEQVMLLLLGAIPAAVVWQIGREGIGLDTIGVYVFIIFYTISVAISIVMQNAKRAQALLSERE